MKANDVVQQLALLLPGLTDKFTDNFSVTSLTRIGTTVTAVTSVAHGLAIDEQANIIGAQTPLIITSLSRSGAIGTLVTLARHDLTEGFNTTVVISGATESEFNGTFVILKVSNRRTVTFTMVDSGPTTATGSPLLLNGASQLQTYNGLKKITSAPTTTSFTYEITSSTLFTPASGTISARTQPRVSSAVSIDAATRGYTKQTPNKLWAFVVLGDVVASKSRAIDSDATDNLQNGNEFRQQTINPVGIYVFFPVSAQIAASTARDNAQDLFRPLCQSLLFSKFNSGLAVGKQNNIIFTDHSFFNYNDAVYVHVYNFETIADLIFEDTIGFDVNVAFRDIDLTMGIDVGTEVMTATIDLDDILLP